MLVEEPVVGVDHVPKLVERPAHTDAERRLELPRARHRAGGVAGGGQ
jgi:hypothetical protein